MTFEIRTAQRQGARLLIQLIGLSGSGKTYTALQLAFGLAGNDASKVVMIDTENKRGSLYADSLPGGARYKSLDLIPPFSPDRYIEAIDSACKDGAEVIVIDSVSHEWESEGGCDWIANLNPRFADWKTAKRLHKRFVTHMLQCPAHIIACTRAREKTDFSDPRAPIKLGLQPIQEKNFSYEATVSLMLHEQGARQDVLKCPAELQSIFGRGDGYIGASDGSKLRAWVDGATQIDPALEHHRGMLLNATESGLQSVQSAWTSTPAKIRKALGDQFKEQIKASAIAYDELRSKSSSTPDAIGALNDSIGQADTASENKNNNDGVF